MSVRSAVRARVLKVDPVNPDPALIREAAGVLRRGGLVAFPTETVYGLAASMQDPQAITELYLVKERPSGKQLTLHVAGVEDVARWGGVVTPLAERLIAKFWPGPVTFVLPRQGSGAPLGFRMPDHPVALAFLREAAVPVVAPSANKSGNPPPRNAGEVLRDLADLIDLVLDAGPAPLGVESTVVDLASNPPRILRPGALGPEVREALASS